MKGKFERKESRGLPGGPNEQFTYVTGVFSVDGYKADSPDVNNPFNVIPSGNITMKGVDFPVIGTDNLGNTKLMKPGKDYKFPGDMVFEVPMAQRGGQMNEEGQKQRNWFDSYIRSDKYLERLGKEMTGFIPGAYDANKVANERWARLMNLRNTPIRFLPESSDISPTRDDVQGVYNADEYPGMIMLRPEYKKGRQGPWSYNTIPLEEMGHATDEGGKRIPQFTKDLLMSTLKDNDLGIPKEEYYYTQPTEYINRLQPLRYLLQEEGIYDASKEDFTEKHLQKAKENTRIELNKHFQDLLRNTKSEKDLINLMNIIAMDEPGQGLPTAQFGIEMDSEVPSNIIEQTPDANYFQKLFRPKYYKDLIKSEMKDLDSYGYNKLLKKEYQLEGGTKAERDEINKIIQGRKDRLQGAKFIEDVDLLKSMGALGAYDKSKNAVIYNKAYKNDSNSIDDHEINHLYDSVKRPGPAFTSKLYDIYKDKNILNSDVIANINNYQPSMTSDQHFEEFLDQGRKRKFDFEKSLPEFSAVRGGVGDPQRGKIIGYTDKATNQFISNQDLGNYVSENYKDIFADPSNYREVISKYKKYTNKYAGDLRGTDEYNQLREYLMKEMPAFRRYSDEDDEFYNQYMDESIELLNNPGDARTVEQVKSDLLNNLKIDSFNPDIFSKEDDLDDREKNIHNFYVPTEVKARLRAIRKEAEKQGYRKGTDFKGYLDKVKNNSPNVRMQYDQIKQKLNVSDEEINELMLLFAKNNQTNNNLPIAQAGKELTGNGGWLPETVVNRFAMSQDEKDYRVKERAALSKYQKDIKDAEDLGQLYPDRVQALKQLAEQNYIKNRGPVYVNPRTAEPQPELRPYEAPSATRHIVNRMANPITALGYATSGEMQPDLITRGNNAYDYIADFRNPFSIGEAAYDAAASYREGDYLGMGLNALGAIPALPFSGKQAKAVIQNTFPESISKIGFSKNNRERLGALVGIPPERSLPRLSSEELKTYRQVQDIGKMRATNKPISEQYRYALDQNIPDEHFEKVFGISKSEVEQILPSVAEQEAIRSSIPIRERFNLERQPRRRSTTDVVIEEMNSFISEGGPQNIQEFISDPSIAERYYGRDGVIRDMLTTRGRRTRGRTIIGPEPRLSLKEATINDWQRYVDNKVPTSEVVNNKLANIFSEYPYHQGSVSENVPSLSLSSSGSLKNVSDKVTSQSNLGINSGDVFTGSLNTSHSSYLPQLKQVFKYQDGSPQFLGYKQMNHLGFLSNYNYPNRDIAKYLNTEIDTQIKRGIIPNDILRPYIKNNNLLLPQYGIKQKQYGGEETNPLFDSWYSRYAKATGNSTNPYDKEHYYDYESFFNDNINNPENLYPLDTSDWHLSSKYKKEGHPRLYEYPDGTYGENYMEGATDTREFQKGGQYIVKSEDTFDGIANRLGINKDEFIKANPGVRGKTLQINQILNVPTSKPKEYKTFAGRYAMENLFAPGKPFDDAFSYKMFEPATELIKQREGYTKEKGEKSYIDSKGKLTGGIGHLLTEAEKRKYPKGTSIPQEQVNRWFEQDTKKSYNAAIEQAEEIGNTDERLINALASVNFQLGENWYKEHKNTWKLLKEGKYNEAAEEAADSNWYKQTPVRVKDFQKTLMEIPNIKRQGGEVEELELYKSYINSDFDNKADQIKAQKVYDKLNRIHYKNAKQFGMSAPNYIMTYLLNNPNG